MRSRSASPAKSGTVSTPIRFDLNEMDAEIAASIDGFNPDTVRFEFAGEKMIGQVALVSTPIRFDLNYP